MPAGAGSGLKASDFVTSKHRVSSHDLPPPRHPHQVGQGPHQKPAHIIYAPRYPCTSLSVHLVIRAPPTAVPRVSSLRMPLPRWAGVQNSPAQRPLPGQLSYLASRGSSSPELGGGRGGKGSERTHGRLTFCEMELSFIGRHWAGTREKMPLTARLSGPRRRHRTGAYGAQSKVSGTREGPGGLRDKRAGRPAQSGGTRSCHGPAPAHSEKRPVCTCFRSRC